MLDQKLCFNMILRLCGNSKYVQLDWLRYVVPEIPNDPILRSDAPFSGLFSPNGIWAPLEFVFLENARLITVQLFDVLRADTPLPPKTSVSCYQVKFSHSLQEKRVKMWPQNSMPIHHNFLGRVDLQAPKLSADRFG